MKTRKTILIIFGGIGLLLCLCSVGLFVYGYRMSQSPEFQVSMTATAVVKATEKAALAAIEAAKPTETPRPSSTPKPTETPKPISTPKPTGQPQPTVQAVATIAKVIEAMLIPTFVGYAL
jgi:hypothetical protein